MHEFSNVTRVKNVIRVYLEMLRLLRIKDGDKTLIKLDEPDYSILPRMVEPK